MIVLLPYIDERNFSFLDEVRRQGSGRRAASIKRFIERLENNNSSDSDKPRKRKRKSSTKKKARKKRKVFSEREIVPRDIAQKARKEGVVQQDRNGDWRIISFKQNPPEFWDAHYDSKEDAEKALGAYHAQKHFTEYLDQYNEDLDSEIYKKAMKKARRKAMLRGALWGLGGGLLGGFFGHSLVGGTTGLLAGMGLGAAKNAFKSDSSNKDFVKAVKEEYEKAYGVKRPRQLGPVQQALKYGQGNSGLIDDYDNDEEER